MLRRADKYAGVLFRMVARLAILRIMKQREEMHYVNEEAWSDLGF